MPQSGQTDRIAPRLLDLQLIECRNEEADQLAVTIHDHDGRMALPARGGMLEVAIGWLHAGIVDKGVFRVDEVEHSGAPDVITIKARSATLTKAMRIRKQRSWHDVTLGAVVGSLAGEHGLQASVHPSLAAIPIPHMDQSDESDVHMLTRLSQRFDAVATVKADTLLFAPIGSGTTGSGLALPRVSIQRAEGDQHRYCVADRDAYSGVRAYWTDKPGKARKSVLVGNDENAKVLRETYATEAIARQFADAERRRLQRGVATLSHTLALGRADLYPEQRVTVSGFKPEIDGTEWLIVKTVHTITGSAGFTTQIEMETAAS